MSVYKQAVVSIVVLFFLISIGYCESCNSNCSVIGGAPKDCVVIDDCFVIMYLMQSVRLDSISDITRSYLRKIHCGWTENGTPKICCPVDPYALADRAGYFNVEAPYRHENVYLLLKHNCGTANKNRILGGQKADLFEFPWMALLSYNIGIRSVFQCGGSLISEKYVLTAAHCITEKLRGVRIGEYDTRRSKDCVRHLNKSYCAPPYQDFLIEEKFKHEYYSYQTTSNDIALIRLKGNVDLTKSNAQPICLPIFDWLVNTKLEGQSAFIAGWGLTEKDKSSEILLKASIEIVNKEDCIKSYRRNFISETKLHLTENKMCAGELGKDSCKGDSGGPLIRAGLYQNMVRYIQYGIISYGDEECNAKTPGIYTKVTKYLDWILDQMKP